MRYRVFGGPVPRSYKFTVGEQGPEFFIPFPRRPWWSLSPRQWFKRLIRRAKA